MTLSLFIVLLVVAALNNLLGMIWYSRKVFGGIWAREHNFNDPDMKPTGMHILASYINSFVIAVAVAILIYYLDLVTATEGALLGAFIWLGFIATTHFSGVIWARKPFKAYLIDMGFQLVSLVMMGAIIAAWEWSA